MPVAHAAAVQRRTSPVELFWDLVFVFAVTQVSTLLARDLSWAGFGRAMLVLALVYCSGTISDLPTSPRGDEETDEPVEGGHVTRFSREHHKEPESEDSADHEAKPSPRLIAPPRSSA